MASQEIGRAQYGELKNITDYSVAVRDVDYAVTDETYYTNTDWTKWHGYYRTIPELRIAIDAKARWVVGKGYRTNPITELLLMSIKGNGKDTFNTIIENIVRIAEINGDSYAEIIREKDYLVNLKPLNPGRIMHVCNKKGLIIRYEDTLTQQKFTPEQIFHLSNNRVADEIHGVSLIEAVENLILMRNEAMSDMKKLLHRHVQPANLFYLDTDDEGKITAFKAKADFITEHGENLYVPSGTVKRELLSVPQNAILNPQPWIERLNQFFYQAIGVPQIVVGGAQEITEATAKILYLAFEQTIREKKLEVEEQILSQLNLEVEFEFPASLMNEMLSGISKSETMQAATKEDTTTRFRGYR